MCFVIYQINTGIKRFLSWCWRGSWAQQNLDLQPHKGIGFVLFLVKLPQRHHGSQISRGTGFSCFYSECREVTGNTDAYCHSKRAQVPSAFFPDRKPLKQEKMTYETAWLWAVQDIESGKKSGRDLHWSNILFTYSTFGRRHSYVRKRFICITEPVDSPKRWHSRCSSGQQFLLKMITLPSSWFSYLILFPEDIKDLIIHSTNT